MTFRVYREVAFDAGHVVVDAHLHRFRVGVTCVGTPASTGPTRGMVADFRILGAALESTVRAPLEGKMMVEECCRDLPQLSGSSVVVLPVRPTVENLARWCYDRLATVLEDPSVIESVQVWETDTCMGSYGP